MAFFKDALLTDVTLPPEYAMVVFSDVTLPRLCHALDVTLPRLSHGCL